MNIISISGNNGVAWEAPGGIATPGKTTKSSKAADSPQTAQIAAGHADVSSAQVKQIVEAVQSQLDGMNINVEYSFYGKHDHEIAVKVVNKETGEVIREIPAKEMQNLQTKIGELVGRIFNGKA